MKLSAIYDINIKTISGSPITFAKSKLDELGKIILNYVDDTISQAKNEYVKRINRCIEKDFKEINTAKGIIDVYCYEPRESRRNKNRLIFILTLRTIGVGYRDSIRIELNKKSNE